VQYYNPVDIAEVSGVGLLGLDQEIWRTEGTKANQQIISRWRQQGGFKRCELLRLPANPHSRTTVLVQAVAVEYSMRWCVCVCVYECVCMWVQDGVGCSCVCWQPDQQPSPRPCSDRVALIGCVGGDVQSSVVGAWLANTPCVHVQVTRHCALATPNSPDQDGLLEYSVVYTDRSVNHMSKQFQVIHGSWITFTCHSSPT
jgi:hypothetical protein